MTDTSERYARFADDFAAKIAAVPPDRWSSPSPCEGWTARDVVRHVVDAHAIFERLVGRDLGDVPSADEDPLAAFEAARKVVAADLEDPERASAEYEGALGRRTFEEAVGGMLCGDLFVHGWDLARATGLDERLDPEECRGELERMREMPEHLMRSPVGFAQAIEPPPGADDQTRLLAFLGRRSWD